MTIAKLKVFPALEKNTEFELNKNNVQSIFIEDGSITITFENDDPIKLVEIPIDNLIKIEFKEDSEWDGKFISFSGDKSIYYKKYIMSPEEWKQNENYLDYD